MLRGENNRTHIFEKLVMVIFMRIRMKRLKMPKKKK